MLRLNAGRLRLSNQYLFTFNQSPFYEKDFCSVLLPVRIGVH